MRLFNKDPYQHLHLPTTLWNLLSALHFTNKKTTVYKYSYVHFYIYLYPRQVEAEMQKKKKKDDCGKKARVRHPKRTDHVSTNNSNVKLIRSAFLLCTTDEEHGPACFQPCCYRYICHLSRQITFVDRPIYEIHDGHVGQTDGHDLTPILSLNTKSSVVTCASRAWTCRKLFLRLLPGSSGFTY